MYVKVAIRILVLALVITLLVPSSFGGAADSQTGQVMLVYDSLARGTAKDGNVETLQRLLAANGMKVKRMVFDDYRKGMLDGYTGVIAVHNADELKISNKTFLQDLETYRGGYLHIGAQVPAKVQAKLGLRLQTGYDKSVRLSIGQLSESDVNVKQLTYIIEAKGTRVGSVSSDHGDIQAPFGVYQDEIAYVPYYEQGSVSKLALAALLKDWLKITEPGRAYLLFKEIYPFSDLKLLESLADQLYEAGIPFIASVRPVFSNTEFPAMQRYLETLKYVQSRNGSIIVNAPAVTSSNDQYGEMLKLQMELFVDILANYSIAPLAIGAEMYWTYDLIYSTFGMGPFNSVVLFPDETITIRSRTDSSQTFESALYSMPLDELNSLEVEGKAIEALPMNIALTYDFFKEEAQLNEAVRTIMNSWITYDDYKFSNHAVVTPAHTIISQNGFLEIDGKRVDRNDAYNSINLDFVYREEAETSFTQFFTVQNQILIVLLTLILGALGVLYVIGRRLYKRKYLNQRRQQ